jgi:hypothetical protein
LKNAVIEVVSGNPRLFEIEIHLLANPNNMLCTSGNQGSFFWLQNMEGELVVGGWLQIHQPQVVPPYFAARKKNPGGNRHLNNTLCTSSGAGERQSK